MASWGFPLLEVLSARLSSPGRHSFYKGLQHTKTKFRVHALQVGDALLDVIFNPDVADGSGLVIDGFPRTALQVPLHATIHSVTNAYMTLES